MEASTHGSSHQLACSDDGCGIEVILDVVYNHTAEGNHLGPALSLKGIDNPTCYRLVPDQPRYWQLHRHRQHPLVAHS